MGKRFFTLMAWVLLGGATLSFVLPAAAQAPPPFVAPKPGQATRPAPATPQAARPATAGVDQPQATRPVREKPVASPCGRVTEAWVDYRPEDDRPVAQGRASSGELFVALDVCQREQVAAPSDRRIAFLLARTFEVNGKGVRATPMFRQLSDGGYPPATTQLARAYAIGSGVARNRTMACDLYLKAAKAGDPWSFNPAADCLSFQDYAHDPRLACRYFQRAQSSGTSQSENMMREDYCQ